MIFPGGHMTRRYTDMDRYESGSIPAKLEGGTNMRHAILLPEGVIVSVRHFDSQNNRVLIEHQDGRCETVAASTIHFLNIPAYSQTTA
jgi:hypothetical protein